MKREIKFRSWDRKRKQFVTCRNDSAGVSSSTDYLGRQSVKAPGYQVLQLFIGIRDGLGQDIYEGDLLEDADGNIGVVESVPGHFVIRHNDGSSDFIAERNIFTVVGNVYENPKLLS